jgi:hypothetical protein
MALRLIFLVPTTQTGGEGELSEPKPKQRGQVEAVLNSLDGFTGENVYRRLLVW